MSEPDDSDDDEPDNRDRAWTAHEGAGGWYYYTDQGHPIGPFETYDFAFECLDDYDATYYD